jgi:hypothetical protein
MLSWTLIIHRLRFTSAINKPQRERELGWRKVLRVGKCAAHLHLLCCQSY